eukprot:11194096-Heterocapsa_arctica.AAC.1
MSQNDYGSMVVARNAMVIARMSGFENVNVSLEKLAVKEINESPPTCMFITLGVWGIYTIR